MFREIHDVVIDCPDRLFAGMQLQFRKQLLAKIDGSDAETGMRQGQRLATGPAAEVDCNSVQPWLGAEAGE
jgi:hypothetical protein